MGTWSVCCASKRRTWPRSRPMSRSMILAADLMRTDVIRCRLEDRVDRALELFVENDLTAISRRGRGVRSQSARRGQAIRISRTPTSAMFTA